MRTCIEGICYDLDIESQTAKVLPYLNEDGEWESLYEGDVIIPEKILFEKKIYTVVAIANGAFMGECIDSITMPNSITHIGKGAFAHSSLSTLIPSENITYVGKGAFNDTPWFEEQPDGIIYIGKVLYAYKGEMLEDISIIVKEGTASITACAFDYYYEEYDDYLDRCFRKLTPTPLKSIIFPNTLTTIGDNAFRNCPQLTTIDIPDSVTYIGGDAFDGTSWYEDQPDGIVRINNVVYKLKGVELTEDILSFDDNVIAISPYAFEDSNICSNITKLRISKNITNIGDGAFCGCNTLASIVVDTDNPIYDSRSNCNAIIETASNTLLFGCSNTIITNSIVNISSYAFEHCADLLQSIFIPKSVERIAARAFAGCSGVTSITVDPENKIYDSRANCNAIIKSYTDILVLGCQNTVIPDGVRTIGYAAFENCKQLKTVFIPSTINKIEDKAFSGCKNLTNIIFLSTNPPKIEGYPFPNKNTSYSENNKGINLYIPSKYGDWIEGTYYIGRDNHKRWQNSFSNFQMHDINFIVNGIHYTITGNYVVKVIPNIYGFFDSAYKTLSNIQIPECVIYNGIKFTVNEISDNTFNDCINLLSINMPDTVIKIGDHAFENCCNLSSVTLSKNLKSIGDFAFDNCSKLTSIIIPKTLVDIGICAFDNELITNK